MIYKPKKIVQRNEKQLTKKTRLRSGINEKFIVCRKGHIHIATLYVGKNFALTSAQASAAENVSIHAKL